MGGIVVNALDASNRNRRARNGKSRGALSFRSVREVVV